MTHNHFNAKQLGRLVWRQNARLPIALFAVGVIVIAIFVGHSMSGSKTLSKNSNVPATSAGQLQGSVSAGGTPATGSALSPASKPAPTKPKSSEVAPTATPVSVAVNGLALSPSTTSVHAGDVLTVSLLENSGSVPVNSVQTKLSYDVASLEFVSADASPDFDVTAATDTKVPGVIRIARATEKVDNTGTRTVTALHFKVKPTAAGNQTVAIDAAESYLVRVAGSANILQSGQGANFTVVRY